MKIYLSQWFLRSSQSGHGTIALLVTFGMIFGMLALLVRPRVFNENPIECSINTSKAMLASLEIALDILRQDVRRFPTTEEGLEALVQRPPGMDRWDGPYLKKAVIPSDVWGHLFMYRSPSRDNNKPYELYSMGPNGVDENGQGDDTTS